MSLRGVLTVVTSLLLLMPLMPATAADPVCVEVVAEACVAHEESSEEDCYTGPDGYSCYDRDEEEVSAQWWSPASMGEVEVERAREHARFHAEVGECTMVDFTGESESYEVSLTGTWLLGVTQAGAYASQGNGTLVYEDPCGEGLVPGLESGTYETTFVRGGTYMVMAVPGASLVVQVAGGEATYEDEDGQTAYCDRGARGYVQFIADMAPPVVVDTGSIDLC